MAPPSQSIFEFGRPVVPDWSEGGHLIGPSKETSPLTREFAEIFSFGPGNGECASGGTSAPVPFVFGQAAAAPDQQPPPVPCSPFGGVGPAGLRGRSAPEQTSCPGNASSGIFHFGAAAPPEAASVPGENTDGNGIFVFGGVCRAGPAAAAAVSGAGAACPAPLSGHDAAHAAPPAAAQLRARHGLRRRAPRRAPRPGPSVAHADGGTTAAVPLQAAAGGGSPQHAATADGAAASTAGPLGSPSPRQEAAPAQAGPGQPAPARHHAALEEAREHLRGRRLTQAVRACLPALVGPDGALELLREVAEALDRAEREQVGAREDERRSLMAQLVDARERSAQLAAERRRRQEAEGTAAALRQRLQREAEALREGLQREREAQREGARLRQQLSEAEHRAQQQRRAPRGPVELAPALARLECGPLRLCAPPERAALRKRLLLKWHPDKQPSAVHAELSKLVMQEMQNCEEWAL